MTAKALPALSIKSVDLCLHPNGVACLRTEESGEMIVMVSRMPRTWNNIFDADMI